MEENKGCGCGSNGCHDEEECGCGHDHDHGHGEPVIYVTFEDEDREVPCNVLGIFEAEEREYIALAPEDSDEVLLYRYSEEGEEVKLDEIETDEEYERIATLFDEIFFEELEENEEE